jgi:hypothetical protein
MAPEKKTHFDQIPLKAIREIIEESARREKMKTGEEARGTKKKDAESDLLETTTANGRSEGV